METKQITYGIEDLVSRIPGLFPYLEFGEDGVTVVHSAKDSLNGCYGRIPCGIRLPEDVGLEVGGITVLEAGGSYSYRTLMNAYYNYSGLVAKTDPFVVFMEMCIGRFRIWDDIDNPEWDLVPEYGYYAECARLYMEYCNISRMCDAYLLMKNDMEEVNCELECLLEKYRRMGGDTIKDYYYSKIAVAEEYADSIHANYTDIDASTIDIPISLVSTENDLGVLSTYIDYWEPGRRYTNGDIVIYNDRTYICTCEPGTYTEGTWDQTTETLVFDRMNFELLTVSDYEHGMDTSWTIGGTVGSSLQIFKEGKTYLDEGGTERNPEDGEDWLWYYKVGSVANYETDTDQFGNISIKSGEARNTVVGEYETNLLAFGNVLTAITMDEENMTVTFTYVMGANLKAVLSESVTDENGNTRYYYNGYAYNDGDSHGVTCEETYYFSGDMEEIGQILENDDFDGYVNGYPFDYLYFKCPFSTIENTNTIVTMINGVPVSNNVRMTNFIVSVDNEKDELVSPVMKKDYLVGITMNPHVDSEVFANRGNAAAWERHVKLGEVKSFEDLVTYGNGGFFNLI